MADGLRTRPSALLRSKETKRGNCSRDPPALAAPSQGKNGSPKRGTEGLHSGTDELKREAQGFPVEAAHPCVCVRPYERERERERERNPTVAFHTYNPRVFAGGTWFLSPGKDRRVGQVRVGRRQRETRASLF